MPPEAITQTPAAPSVSFEKSELLSQISYGPTLADVASQVLKEALDTLYPELIIDPDRCMVATPHWRVDNNHVVPDSTHFETLSLALIRLNVSGLSANYIAGEHFLTTEHKARTPRHLAVDIEVIGAMLNDYSPLLFVEYQARQLAFWNQTGKKSPRWEELSDSLRKAVNVTQVKGWSADECAMARHVSVTPDKAERRGNTGDFTHLQACLIDIDVLQNEVTSHLLIGSALVLRATYQQRQLVTMFTIGSGFESFESLQQLGTALSAHIADPLKERPLQWRLFEPDGNIFDHMAWALVASQLDTIDSLRHSGPAPASTAIRSLATNGQPQELERLETLETSIPDWLRYASATDISDYSLLVSKLGKLYQEQDLEEARQPITPITQFAFERMKDAVINGKPSDAEQLPFEKLEITVINSFTAGDLTLPNPLDSYTETLADFALENSAPYMTSLHFNDGTAVPEWLTPDLLLKMSRQVDVGKFYPEMLESKLLEDPIESGRQARFYQEQLRILLPLAALESKVKHENGIDKTGYSYIVQLMDQTTDTSRPVVICPLALTPQHRLISSQDSVANMFIIGRRDANQGPCLLYRPLFARPLMQFPSRQNLLYALHQPGELRDSVLAWLADKALSFEYSQYVFPVGLPSPWLITEQLTAPLTNLSALGSVVFGNSEITDNLFLTLFNSHAQAMVEMANRQSQSNADQRWALFRDSNWALFNVASNFLSGAVGTAVWVWQSIEAIQQAVDAHERGDGVVAWTSLGDVLLTLGIILTHHAISRRTMASGKPNSKHLLVGETLEPVHDFPPLTLDPTPLLAQLPPDHCSSLEVAGSVPRRAPDAMSRYLNTLAVVAPDLANENLGKINEYPPHLYQLDSKTYAQVGQRWFEVSTDDDAQVTIHQPGSPTRSGPLLHAGVHGLWYLDFRLRLRGGGPKNRLKDFKKAKEMRAHYLEDEINTFRNGEEAAKFELTQAQTAMTSASADNRQVPTAAYLEKLEERISAYEQARKNVQEWRTQSGTSGYVYDLLRITTELQKHQALWYNVKCHQYNKLAQRLISEPPDTVKNLQPFMDAIKEATDIGHQIIESLQRAHASLEDLKVLGKTGIVKALKMEKMLPKTTALDFKANEIGLSHVPAMQMTASPLMDEARDAVGEIIIKASRSAMEVARLMKKTTAHSDPKAALEELSTLDDSFSDAEQRIEELPERYPDLVNPARLSRLRALIGEFRQIVQNELDSVLLNHPHLTTPQAPPERPGPSRPALKVSKSRPRIQTDSDSGESEPEPEQVDTVIPKSRQPPKPTLDDMGIIEEGLDQTLEMSRFIEHTIKDASRPHRIPADMQEIFEQYALKLQDSAMNVDQAMARLRANGKNPPVATLSQELREASARVRKQGIETRANMYKLRKPTQGSFRWMHNNAQLKFTRNPLGRIQTKKRGDYFQEYSILDRTNKDQPLWVAHFHYKTAHSSAAQPETAHLKIADSYLETLTSEQQLALNTVQPVDGVLRRLTDLSLRDLFLALEPQKNALAESARPIA